MSIAIAAEIEAKLLVPHETDLSAIAQLSRIGAYRLRQRETVQLHSTYLDTADFALARRGIALRMRRQGKHWEATAKWGGELDGEIHERPELNVTLPRRPPLPFVLPEGPLRLQLLALVAGRELRPVLAADIRRQRREAVPIDAADDAPALAELDLDLINLHAPAGDGPARTYCEVEVECLGGERRDVAELARLLQRGFRLTASPDSKFSYGMKLLYGPQVLRCADTRLRDDDTLAAAVRKITNRHLERVQRYDPGTRLGEDTEALHDMRVAVRRLRALLRAFGEGFPAAARRRFDAELRWLGQVLGSVRDLDVQLAQLTKDAAAAPPRQRVGLEGLRNYLGDERARRRAQMLEALESPRYLELIAGLDRFAARPARRGGSVPGAAPVAAAGRRAIRKAYKRLVKRGDKARAEPTPEDLHELRIRAKRVRYLLEFVSDLSGKLGARLVRRVVRLQDLLGDYHDAVVAADAVQHYVEAHGAAEKPGTLLALGALVNGHLRAAEQARGSLERTWVEFRRKPTRRKLHAVIERLEGLAGEVESLPSDAHQSRAVRRGREQRQATAPSVTRRPRRERRRAPSG